jgi:hypothetical protein
MPRILCLFTLTAGLLLLPALAAQEKPDKPDKAQPAKTDKAKPVKAITAKADEDKPAKPDKDKPAKPDKDKPAKPDKDKPAKPDKDKPAKPDKDKPAKPDKDKPIKERPEKLDLGYPVSGKIIHWEANQKYFTLQVTYKVPNPQGYQQLAQLQMRMATARTPRDRMNVQREMMQSQANLYKDETRSVEIQATADMKIRLYAPPVIMDDKTNKPKALTKKDLAELKGPDPRLPGYTGEMSDLRQDVMATVFLPTPQKTGLGGAAVGKVKDPKKPGKPPVDPEKPVVSGEGNRLEALMILIYPDALALPRKR